jgi:SAM-dependent methyltransferase
MSHKLITDGHLGGYFAATEDCPYGDEKTYLPQVWDKFIELFKPKTMLDVGCGEGHAVNYFRAKGVEGYGIDGCRYAVDRKICRHIVLHDYTKGPLNFDEAHTVDDQQIPTDYDFCWSAEFVEHVEERFSVNFLASFAVCKIVAMTHGLPGQGGYHHVNCRAPEYWIERMKQIGFTYDKELTEKIRTELPHGYWGRSGLLFRRT